MKHCSRCKTDKPLTDFGKHAALPDGLRRYCKPCHNAMNKKVRSENVEAYRKANREYAQSDRGRELMRVNNLRRKYWPHMTNEQAAAEYDRILAEQGGTCALCDATETSIGTRLHVDHDKHSGQVRGILCDFHNRVVVQDKTKDDVMKLFNYFKKFYVMD